MNQKKVLIILIATLFGLITFLGGYLLANKNTGQTASIYQLSRFSEKEGEKDVRSKTSTISGMGRISTVKALSPAISEDGRKILYFEKGTGKILASDFSGQSSRTVSGQILNGFNSALWSKNGYETIVSGQEGKSYNNIKSATSSKISPNIKDVAWSKDGKKTAYLYFEAEKGEGSISIANPDGSSFKNIFQTRIGNLKISWPKENLISFYNPTGPDNSLFLLDIESGLLEKKLVSSFDSLKNLEIIWSPDGSKVLYSRQNEDGSYELRLLDLVRGIDYETGLATTADKCVWTLNSLALYCGARKESETSENLYHIDIVKKEFGLAFEPSTAETIAIKNPILSPTENLLFFVNQQDGYLYSISLP